MDSSSERPGLATPFEFNKIQLSHLGVIEFNPECFVQNFLRIKDKPVLVTENGIYTDDDRFRVVWILEYLRALRECIDLGVDVRGYLHWSLLDNYEWGIYELRFGLVHVDYENNFKRTIKPSAHFYREIIENNGYKKEMLTKYVKELPRCVDYTAKDGFLPENVN